MDALMDVSLKIFPDPGGKGGGYYQMDITPNASAAAKLGRFPKDVIFVIDISGSISHVKLDEFKAGVVAGLTALGPADRFDVVAFASRTHRLFGALADATPGNLSMAANYVNSLSPHGSTNIYGALRPLLGSAVKSPGRPLLVFLLSDGNVNEGQIKDSRQLINDLSNGNQDKASVFTFSCGQNSNDFLLSLLAYRNRGEYLELDSVAAARAPLSRFLADVASIAVADLSYQTSLSLEADTFPKRLPHLYQGHTLSIFGRYPPGTDRIPIRIAGVDATGAAQALVAAPELAAADATDATIPRKWARQRIFHMYSQLTARHDPELAKRIAELAKAFAIPIPFAGANLSR